MTRDSASRQTPSFTHSITCKFSGPLTFPAITRSVNNSFCLIFFSCSPSQMQRIDASSVPARVRNFKFLSWFRSVRPKTHQSMWGRGPSAVVDHSIPLFIKREWPINARAALSPNVGMKKRQWRPSGRSHWNRIQGASASDAHVMHIAKPIALGLLRTIRNGAFHLLMLSARRHFRNRVSGWPNEAIGSISYDALPVVNVAASGGEA